MPKRCNTPRRRRVVKTRMTEEEYKDFAERLSHYGMSAAEFIRQSIRKAVICHVVQVSPVNDELLSAIGKLTAEYGKIGGNLNQIARALNEYGELPHFIPSYTYGGPGTIFPDVMPIIHDEMHRYNKERFGIE